ncbi:hypothetical protein B0H10DRAFT_1950487 [Mycena sp. CBHHK59/15]|nr:hypothetical protein B0H10DRAFT_1950487 [Mycena sp. CBHHK59/15]
MASQTTQEDRLLVVLRCMQRAGFETLGDFFAASLADGNNTHPAVYQSVSAFLQYRGIDVRTHPVSIVERIFTDHRSQKRDDADDDDLQFNLPRYALPPSQRLSPALPDPPRNTTRNSLIDWALHVMIKRWQTEAEILLLPALGFTRDPDSLSSFAWINVLSWNMTKNQETIAVNAPAIFACMTSVSVNKRAQKKLDRAAAATVPEPDSDDTDNESVPLGTGVLPKMRRDPWLGTTVTIFILLYFRYKYSLVFPAFIGLFLFTCNAHRDIFALLSRIGFSIAYSTVLDTLHILAADSNTQLQLFGAVAQASEPMFLLLFDNVNKMKQAWQQTLGHRDELTSGCAATLIGLEDVPEGAMNSKELLRNVKEKKRAVLTVDKLIDNIDWKHIKGVGVATPRRVWTKHAKAMGKHPLHLRKSVIHPMRSTNVDEAQTTGVASELRNLVLDQLLIATHWLNCWLIMICGDQLSIDRICKIKKYMFKTDTVFDRHDWALPIIQLWHLKWNWQKAIFRHHWYDPVGKDIFGLHHNCDLLTRDKFNPVKCDFYLAHHILEDRFVALMLDCLREDEDNLRSKNTPDRRASALLQGGRSS